MNQALQANEHYLTENEAQMLQAFEQLSAEDQMTIAKLAEHIDQHQETVTEPMNRDDIEALFAAIRKAA